MNNNPDNLLRFPDDEEDKEQTEQSDTNEVIKESNFYRIIELNQLERNFEGKIVDPRTREPVRRGSPEWRELARRNMLPRNQ